jgi:aspartate/methionine/tyrosine aminotransferase
MQIPQPFKLERYFDRYEFNVPYLLSPSDCESLSLSELLSMADSTIRELWEKLSLGYTEASGHPFLRQAIASLYTHTSPDQVLVLAPEEGIFIAMHTLLSPGDEVICISPAYQSLHEIAHSIGCRVVPWPLTPGLQSWSVDIDQLADSISDKTRLVVINFPHNPTGYLLSRSDLESLITLARQHQIYVFSDEMYRLLEYNEGQRLPSICDIYERGISLSGMSKSLAMPGLRIGWLATADKDLRNRWITLKDYTTICSSAPSEILALIGLNAMDQILPRNLKIINDNLAAAEAFFSRHAPEFDWFPPQAGSVAFPKWNGPGTVNALCQELVDSQGVLLVPGSLFEVPGGHFRLGLGRRNFPEALERLEHHLLRRS